MAIPTEAKSLFGERFQHSRDFSVAHPVDAVNSPGADNHFGPLGEIVDVPIIFPTDRLSLMFEEERGYGPEREQVHDRHAVAAEQLGEADTLTDRGVVLFGVCAAGV